ncbi:TPA: hypothetical protein MNF69_002277 [Klebsiella oxytoca]|uniref:tail fiber/spike domain-containing protein n=1 Tax=Klebsiella grimontii TaxID=2058152 RepID=UPI0031B716ED|nr:hypothetical protein [Klebsiella oxytoca]HCA0301674.1 hypothetical protein [Klebsiella oxytoca]HCA1151912.1 hypothetical protein [Klebsiella oxytoca]HCA1998327.1 hypothetical protein [Klebsiella oxytoca]HCA2191481.1 hypothetical protein [Klebsiella oxytoca]
MTNIAESPSWEDNIEIIGRTEKVSGGQDGVANRPLRQLANRTRYLLEKHDDMDADLSEKVAASRTFIAGATLGSPREEILHGNYRLVWTGAFPKTVPAGSTPETTGGVGPGLWAYTSDAVIRRELSSRAGTSLVNDEDNDPIQKSIALAKHGINYVTPQMGFSSIQEAATHASENKVKLRLGPYHYDIYEPIEVWGSLCIEGDGEDFSKLIQKAGATGDAVIIQHLQDVNDTVQFSGFSVETEKRFILKNTAITVDGTALIPSPGGQIPRRTKGRGIFRNLRVCGTAENRSENIGFGVGFDLRSLGWYDMESINVSGCAELGTEYKSLGIGLLQRGGGWVVEINQSRLRFYNLEYAWYCPDYVEGLFLDKYQFVNVRNGIVGGVHDDVWSLDPAGKLGMYQPFIGPGHINASDVAIYINNVSYGTVTDVFAMMNDKGVATSVNAAHLRGGIRNSVHNLNILHYSTNTGLSRKSLILNNISDSFVSNMNSETKSDEYEKHDVAIQFVSSSFRNQVDGLKVARANTAVLNGEGCGNNVINGYRADGVATPVMDNAGDMVRGNTEGRNVVFSPAGAAEYVITVTPRQYLSRRPLGVSCDVIRPTTVPMNIFYDRDSSSPSAIVLKVRPITTPALPTIECEISLIIHD